MTAKEWIERHGGTWTDAQVVNLLAEKRRHDVDDAMARLSLFLRLRKDRDGASNLWGM